jgi:hypothetical protein
MNNIQLKVYPHLRDSKSRGLGDAEAPPGMSGERNRSRRQRADRA